MKSTFADMLQAPMWRAKTVCQMFCISRNTLREWTLKGWIPAPTYMGKTPLWDRVALLTQLRNQANIVPSGVAK